MRDRRRRNGRLPGGEDAARQASHHAHRGAGPVELDVRGGVRAGIQVAEKLRPGVAAQRAGSGRLREEGADGSVARELERDGLLRFRCLDREKRRGDKALGQGSRGGRTGEVALLQLARRSRGVGKGERQVRTGKPGGHEAVRRQGL